MAAIDTMSETSDAVLMSNFSEKHYSILGSGGLIYIVQSVANEMAHDMGTF